MLHQQQRIHWLAAPVPVKCCSGRHSCASGQQRCRWQSLHEIRRTTLSKNPLEHFENLRAVKTQYHAAQVSYLTGDTILLPYGHLQAQGDTVSLISCATCWVAAHFSLDMLSCWKSSKIYPSNHGLINLISVFRVCLWRRLSDIWILLFSQFFATKWERCSMKIWT